MRNTHKKRYVRPAFLQQADILLERDLLTASVAKNIPSVETAGQEISGDFSGSTISPDGKAFNYDWGN